ncbi:GIY-YIG nuclease family protein [Microvirga lenta]|uniref:hypothetical protein n=1 Tax=Microvirga lenta TaxID=2881337 RepID=UPI001CFFF62A|nr:hypothetical protein [Microvirga lenta]MCB5175540.1 hypothetical protein [Microvirga lenta]
MSAGVFSFTFKDGSSFLSSAINLASRMRQHRALLAAGVHPCAELQQAFESGGREIRVQIVLACNASDLRTYEQRILNASPASFLLPDLSPTDVARLVEIERERINATEEAERERLAQVKAEEWEFPALKDHELPPLPRKMTTPEEREQRERERLARIEQREAVRRANKELKAKRKMLDRAKRDAKAETRAKMAAARRLWWARSRAAGSTLLKGQSTVI